MRTYAHYGHIIWDFNGTILDDFDFCLSIQAQMLSARGLPPISKQQYKETFSFPIKDWYASMGYDVSEYDQIALWWAKVYEEGAPALCRANPGALALLSDFSRAQIPQSVLSASQEGQLRMLLASIGILERFAFVCGLSNHRAESKTHRALWLVDSIGIPGDQILLIGDTLHDLSSARAIGCDCVLVAQGHQSLSRLRSEWGDVFESFDELKERLAL